MNALAQQVLPPEQLRTLSVFFAAGVTVVPTRGQPPDSSRIKIQARLI